MLHRRRPRRPSASANPLPTWLPRISAWESLPDYRLDEKTSSEVRSLEASRSGENCQADAHEHEADYRADDQSDDAAHQSAHGQVAVRIIVGIHAAAAEDGAEQRKH